MCGISGVVTNIDIENKIKFLIEGLNRRGPDFKDYKIFRNFALGHARLSIIDLDKRSNQPMISKSKKSVISFNGEIYNYKDLKKNYFQNFNFKTTGDTEVLLEGIEKYGFEFLQKIRGFFSLCFYDLLEEKIYLIRDEYGKKPLYYYYKNSDFYFSSELHSLTKIIKSDHLNINNNGLANYLWKGYFNENNTIYENIKSLEPGKLLIFDQKINSYTIKKILNELVFNESNTFTDINEIEKKIEESVEIRKVSDVKISYLLSGGLDSSIICNLASKHETIETFYVKFNKKNSLFDKLSRLVSEKIQSNHNILNINDLDLNQVLELNYDIFHEPFADYSSIPSYLLFKKISEKYKVVITGDGADELFGGYQDYKIFYLKNLLRFNSNSYLVKLFLDKLIHHRYLPKKFIYILSTLFLSDSQIYNIMYNGGWNLLYRKDFMLNKIFSQFFNENIEKREELKFKNSGKNPLERSFNSYLERLKNDFIVKVDRTSMYNSLEARSPFLDKSLFLSIANRKLKSSLSSFQSKYELKKIAKKNGLDFITKIKKEGFTLPLEKYLLNQNNRDILQTIASNNSIVADYFDIKKIKSIINNERKISQNTFRLWILLVFNHWHLQTKKF